MVTDINDVISIIYWHQYVNYYLPIKELCDKTNKIWEAKYKERIAFEKKNGLPGILGGIREGCNPILYARWNKLYDIEEDAYNKWKVVKDKKTYIEQQELKPITDAFPEWSNKNLNL